MVAAIRVNSLGKCYPLVQGAGERSGYRTLREDLMSCVKAPLRWWTRKTNPADNFWALKDVSFDVPPGQVVGIIGRNGAGKSTLLKVMSRITQPSTGEVRLRGRVGSLLEVGTGFHPELSGRENIFLNGAILGMRRAEIARKFDPIVEFSEIGAFLDTPVKRYSSGMYVRLAFAVAAHLETEILIVDEVLAVGDLAFQRKCLGKMQALSEGGRTVLFVSHNMPAVRSLTQRCVYMHKGQVKGDGPTGEVIEQYLGDAWDSRRQGGGNQLEYYRRDRSRNPSVTLQRLWITGGDNAETPTLNSGDDFTIHMEFTSDKEYPRAFSGLWLTNQQGERVATFFNADNGFAMPIRKGRQAVACRINGLPLSPGRYTVTLGINEGVSTVAWDVIVDYPAFHVVLPDLDNGRLEWPHRPWGCVHWTDACWSEEEATP